MRSAGGAAPAMALAGAKKHWTAALDIRRRRRRPSPYPPTSLTSATAGRHE